MFQKILRYVFLFFIIIYKNKGSKDDYTKYRSIGLLNHVYTIMTVILLCRLVVECSAFSTECQAGFRTHRDCRDNVLRTASKNTLQPGDKQRRLLRNNIHRLHNCVSLHLTVITQIYGQELGCSRGITKEPIDLPHNLQSSHGYRTGTWDRWHVCIYSCTYAYKFSGLVILRVSPFSFIFVVVSDLACEIFMRLRVIVTDIFLRFRVSDGFIPVCFFAEALSPLNWEIHFFLCLRYSSSLHLLL